MFAVIYFFKNNYFLLLTCHVSSQKVYTPAKKGTQNNKLPSNVNSVFLGFPRVFIGPFHIPTVFTWPQARLGFYSQDFNFYLAVTSYSRSSVIIKSDHVIGKNTMLHLVKQGVFFISKRINTAITQKAMSRFFDSLNLFKGEAYRC